MDERLCGCEHPRPEDPEAERRRSKAFVVLWTMLSRFESLPPSQPSLTLRASYG